MEAGPKDFKQFQTKLFVVVLMLFIFLLLTNPFAVSFSPLLNKGCFPIGIIAVITILLLPGRFGEVFVSRAGGRVAKVYVSDNHITPQLLVSLYLSLFLFYYFILIAITDPKDPSEELLPSLVISIFFVFSLLIIALILMKPTSISYDGWALRVVPSVPLRYSIDKKNPSTVHIPSGIFLAPLRYLILGVLRGGVKEVVIPKEYLTVRASTTKDTGKGLALLQLKDKRDNGVNFYVLLNKDKNLYYLLNALKEMLGPDWDTYVVGKKEEPPGDSEVQNSQLTYAGAQSSP